MKGANGALGCRLSKPSGDTPATMPVESVDTTPEENISKKKIKVEFEVRNEISKEKIQSAAAGRHAEGHYTQFLDEDKERGEGEDSGPDVSLPDSRLIVWEVKRPKLCALPKYSSDSSSKNSQKD